MLVLTFQREACKSAKFQLLIGREGGKEVRRHRLKSESDLSRVTEIKLRQQSTLLLSFWEVVTVKLGMKTETKNTLRKSECCNQIWAKSFFE